MPQRLLTLSSCIPDHRLLPCVRVLHWRPAVRLLRSGRHLPLQRLPLRVHLLRRVVRARRLPQAAGQNSEIV